MGWLARGCPGLEFGWFAGVPPVEVDPARSRGDPDAGRGWRHPFAQPIGLALRLDQHWRLNEELIDHLLAVYHVGGRRHGLLLVGFLALHPEVVGDAVGMHQALDGLEPEEGVVAAEQIPTLGEDAAPHPDLALTFEFVSKSLIFLRRSEAKGCSSQPSRVKW